MKSRQVPFFLYWRVENVQFWTNSIGHLDWLSRISNFPRFHKNVNSLELWKYVSENSSPKGSFWSNKRKSEFSFLSWDSRYLWAVALKWLRFLDLITWLVKTENCSLQFWISLGQHLLELRNFILLILSYLFSRYLAFGIFFANLSP